MSTYKAPGQGEVVDIGGSQMIADVGERLKRCLGTDYGSDEKLTLPDELLYTDVGLPIWNEIIFVPEFYQTHDEIAIFDINGPNIAKLVKSGVTMIDLGAGDTRKVEHLLAAFEASKVESTYLALDISRASLEHNVDYLAKKHSGPDDVVTCAGIWGTFEDGLAHVREIQTPRLFLSLGSVLCNDPWPQALDHLKYWAKSLRPDDYLLVGMDAHLVPKDTEKIWASYHSCDELYRQFFVSGFEEANKLLGQKVFKEEDWEFCAELEEEPTTRHRRFFRAKRDVHLGPVDRVIPKGEEFDWFDSHKYGEESVRLMCYKTGLTVAEVWQAPGSEFRQYLLQVKKAEDEKEDADSAVSGLTT